MDYMKDPLRNVPYVAPEDTRPTRLVAAAVLQDDHVWTGIRHGWIIPIVFEDTGKSVYQDQQGFWTDDNRFVMRTAAQGIAWRHGQISKDFPHNKTLLSEYLWDSDGNPITVGEQE